MNQKAPEKTQKIINEIRNALDTIAHENGVDIRVPCYRFDDNKITFSCEINMESEKQKFKRLAPQFGLDPNSYGKIIRINNQGMEIYGINENNYKMPVLLKNNNGKFKTTVDSVKFRLAQ